MIATRMIDNLRYLLLQVRDPDDPMHRQEVGCFARALRCDEERIGVLDLLNAAPDKRQLNAVDMVLLGGSGNYSAIDDGAWVEPALDGLRLVHELSKPTFASCWGFQAMARAMGGEVVNDLDRAELGTHELRLTSAGRRDPVFGPLKDVFQGQMGHEDCVVRLPRDATLLASTRRVENQAYRFEGRPIYCTQFHPELNRANLLERVVAYPHYVNRIAGMTLEKFAQMCQDTPETEALLRRIVDHVFPT